MTTKTLEANEYSLKEIFCDSYSFEIPRYQRPYSWEVEQAVTLVDDLLQFLEEQPQEIQHANPYFLGSIVLIKPNGVLSQIVDGQQRITTLTIVFSVLRSLVSPEFKGALENAIFQKGDPILMTEDKPRLRTRSRDQAFFNQYIQQANQLDNLQAIQEELNDSQKNMHRNALAIKKRLEDESPETLKRLCQLLLVKCFLVVVKTLDVDSAYRIFSVMNDRGLDLSATDILKSLITSEITPTNDKQEIYTKKWEDIEEDLGRNAFNALFAHIRMIEMRTKSRSNLVADFKIHIKPNEQPEQFIDEQLTPYSDAFSDILSRSFSHPEHSQQINQSLKWLNNIDNNDWMPVAIYYIAKYRQDGKRLAEFLKQLECVASVQMINRIAVNHRLIRYKAILDAIDLGSEFDDSALQLANKDKSNARKQLDGDLYLSSRIRSMVLLRLDAELSDGTASYDLPKISVEHVMPQKIADQSKWHSWCPAHDVHQHWVHRLGNLVLLSRNKNSAASNYDFEKKKNAYFLQHGSSTPFILTNQVLSYETWTPDIIETRQQILLEKLCQIWKLND